MYVAVLGDSWPESSLSGWLPERLAVATGRTIRGVFIADEGAAGSEHLQPETCL